MEAFESFKNQTHCNFVYKQLLKCDIVLVWIPLSIRTKRISTIFTLYQYKNYF